MPGINATYPVPLAERKSCAFPEVIPIISAATPPLPSDGLCVSEQAGGGATKFLRNMDGKA
jgi:hypothetical protein